MAGPPLFMVDAFTEVPYAGNPAAVCVLLGDAAKKPLGETSQQRLAAEMNVSETSFVVATADPTIFTLRWFTPTTEVPLCGHATLASAHILFTEGFFTGPEITFETKSRGTLKVRKDEGSGRLVMDFPIGDPQPLVLTPSVQAAVLDALNISTPEDVVSYAHCKLTRKVLIQLKDPDMVASLSPKFERLTSIPFDEVGASSLTSCIVTAKGGGGTWAGFDCVSRNFGPWVGIPEDPVTGSAHTVLAVFWGKGQGESLVGRQCSKRGGTVYMEPSEEGRVLISGHACTVHKGLLVQPLE